MANRLKNPFDVRKVFVSLANRKILQVRLRLSFFIRRRIAAKLSLFASNRIKRLRTENKTR
jgi:hypothetical protein